MKFSGFKSWNEHESDRGGKRADGLREWQPEVISKILSPLCGRVLMIAFGEKEIEI
jgi:hypothetical protein